MIQFNWYWSVQRFKKYFIVSICETLNHQILRLWETLWQFKTQVKTLQEVPNLFLAKWKPRVTLQKLSKILPSSWICLETGKNWVLFDFLSSLNTCRIPAAAVSLNALALGGWHSWLQPDYHKTLPLGRQAACQTFWACTVVKWSNLLLYKMQQIRRLLKSENNSVRTPCNNIASMTGVDKK